MAFSALRFTLQKDETITCPCCNAKMTDGPVQDYALMKAFAKTEEECCECYQVFSIKNNGNDTFTLDFS